MKVNNKRTGNKGEDIAAEHLVTKGYTLLERNYRNKWGELDIICKFSNPQLANSQISEEYIVFVEVKTKTEEMYGEPWEMVDRAKLKKVENMGHLWCGKYGWEGLCRVDVIGVWLDELGEVKRVEHWENVQL